MLISALILAKVSLARLWFHDNGITSGLIKKSSRLGEALTSQTPSFEISKRRTKVKPCRNYRF